MALLKVHSENYFADAWQAREYVSGALHEVLPRDDIGLAINSLRGRSQDQLHIHIDCIRPDVRAALHKNEASLGSKLDCISRFPGRKARQGHVAGGRRPRRKQSLQAAGE